MAGHNKWSQIKRKKAINDNKRGQAFTKLIREITVAAPRGWGESRVQPATPSRRRSGQGRQHAGGQHRAGDQEGHR